MKEEAREEGRDEARDEITDEPHEELCDNHRQNMVTKMCYGFQYIQEEMSRIANAFERIAKVMEKRDGND